MFTFSHNPPPVLNSDISKLKKKEHQIIGQERMLGEMCEMRRKAQIK